MSRAEVQFSIWDDVLPAIPTPTSASTMDRMTAARPLGEIPQPAPDLRLLVELPSWPREFVDNLRDLVSPQQLPPLELHSLPAPFWPDVFVKSEFPWNRFVESGASHVVAFALLIGFTRFFAMQPQVVVRPAFDHNKVIYYQSSEYLPPLDTRNAHVAQARKADPVLARQAIISVPPEADNRSQTIVTAPRVKLKRDVGLPNLLAWSEKMSDKMEKPRLAIPPVPLISAAGITRIAPRMEHSVVIPPPDVAHLANLPRKNSPALQASVVAPPPSVDAASVRPLGDLNIGRSSVIAPAPQISLAEQRADFRSRSAPGVGQVPNVVAPPPSVSTSSSSGESFGARGHVIALNLHPDVVAPPNPPAGNRRGAFAATPEGHVAASGTPGAASTGKTGNSKDASGSSRHGASDMPQGLYVGSAGAKPSPVAGDSTSASTNSVNPNLIASFRPSRGTGVSARSMQAEGATKLSEAEREVFGNRRFYSVTLNMPNLNSAGGSWVVHFAELNHDSNNHDSNNHDSDNHGSTTSAADLSQPTATRKVDPGYPLQLMRENVSGTVILYAIIRANGTVGGVRVLRGVDDRLDQFASRAVAQWQFQPAMKNGSPVDVEATFQIPFKPSHIGTNF
jgi:TonB family protein